MTLLRAPSWALEAGRLLAAQDAMKTAKKDYDAILKKHEDTRVRLFHRRVWYLQGGWRAFFASERPRRCGSGAKAEAEVLFFQC